MEPRAAFCSACNAECGTLKGLKAHMLGKKHAQRVKQAARPDGLAVGAGAVGWHPDLLERLPMSATILDPSTMVSDLSEELRDLVLDGYAAQFDRTSPEWARIFRQLVLRHPKSLRVKELFETAEMYRIVEYAVSNLRRKRLVRTIYDMACGHGLLGIMLAYRFHDLKVVCVDLEKRDGFSAYMQVVEECGVRLPGEACILGNVTFQECDLQEVQVEEHSFVLCVHACNEATGQCIELAQAAKGSSWAVMPCCLRKGIYFEGGVGRVQDDLRYAMLVGYIAGKYGGAQSLAIDRRITNRNLVVLGGDLPICKVGTLGVPDEEVEAIGP